MTSGDTEQRDGLSPRAFATAFREAIDANDVTLDWLAKQLSARGSKLSVATLSYWRSGQRRPGGARSTGILAHVEELLGLSNGSLSTLVDRDHDSPKPSELELDDLVVPARVRAALADNGMVQDIPLHCLSTHAIVTVGESGTIGEVEYRYALRAGGRVIDRAAVVLTHDLGADARYEVVHGARLERPPVRLGAGIYAAELHFDRPIAAGQTAMVQTRVLLERSFRVEDSFEYYLPQRVGECTVWARYSPGRVPARAQAHLWDESNETTSSIDMNGAASAHNSAQRFGPGVVGLRWWWD